MSRETMIERFAGLKILVAGDFLLDEFVFSDISRVSREAPVLILKYLKSEFRPGGAANTVANVASLGAQAVPLGFIGDDEVGRQLVQAWPGGVDASHVFRDAGLATTRKARILAGSFQSFRQQVVRIDYEHPFQLDGEQEARLCSALEELVPVCDAVILSDYSLGNLSKAVRRAAIQLARRHGRPITVDSRDDPFGYQGATTVTPNISELESV
ncbi:MAG: PfkB family carbohydrate kinase, partial [Acidobacteriota bacterium]